MSYGEMAMLAEKMFGTGWLSQLALLLGVSESTIKSWQKTGIPANMVAKLLRMLIRSSFKISEEIGSQFNRDNLPSSEDELKELFKAVFDHIVYGEEFTMEPDGQSPSLGF